MAEEKTITRTYTVPLRRGFANTPRHRRTHKAVRVLKEFLVKHFKATDVKLGKHLNDLLWENGIRNPPPKVKVTGTKDKDGIVKVELEGKAYAEFKVKEKTERNQTFQEKLKGKVSGTKGTEEPEAKAPKADVKATTPTTEAKPIAKKTVPKKSKTELKKEVPEEKAPALKKESPKPAVVKTETSKPETKPEAKKEE